MFSRQELEAAQRLVYTQMQPTPQYAWPQLAALTGAEIWVKHANHTPTGSFTVRGAVTLIDWVRRTYPDATGICTATRRNPRPGHARAANPAGRRATGAGPPRPPSAGRAAFGDARAGSGRDA